MNEVHATVARYGVQKAREMAESKQDRRLVEIAAEMLAEGAERIGISYAGFSLKNIPHKETRQPLC